MLSRRHLIPGVTPHSPRMTDLPPTVFIVDDDESVRRSLTRLVKSAGVATVSFASGSEFFQVYPPGAPGCLVLDIQMPGLSGLDLQDLMARHKINLPVIFLTGHGDVPVTVRAMKNGAADFLQKPVDDHVLIKTIGRAMERNRIEGEESRLIEDIQRRLNLLTPREREVLEEVISGLLNKQIAYRLKIAEKTVKVHRGRIMEKMAVRSVAELVGLSARAGIQPQIARGASSREPMFLP